MKNKTGLIVLIVTTFATSVALGANETGTETGNVAVDDGVNLTPETELKLATAAKEQADSKVEDNLDQFGFGPALYVIKYNKEVLNDSKDVSVKGDNTISSKGSKYTTSLGLELHYDFTFWRTLKCFNDCKNTENWNLSSGHRLSPFLGFYDVSNGINGIAAGLVYGYWKGDRKSKNKTTLNVGLGWTVHKDRLVLADGVSENAVPPPTLNVEDYTQKEDVEGITLMISVNMGF